VVTVFAKDAPAAPPADRCPAPPKKNLPAQISDLGWNERNQEKRRKMDPKSALVVSWRMLLVNKIHIRFQTWWCMGRNVISAAILARPSAFCKLITHVAG
jgi:hypothetical protein